MTDIDNEKDRRYFRILDFVGLDFRQISVREYNTLKLASQYADVPSLDALAELDQQIQLVVDKLKIKSPDVADLGMLLNKKLQLILEHSNLGEGLLQLGNIPQVEVDISACGIAFPSEIELEPEQLLQLDIVLPVGRQHLKMLARVVASDLGGEILRSDDNYNQFVIRAEFIDVSEQIQEFLIQYLVKRQGALIKASRGDAPRPIGKLRF